MKSQYHIWQTGLGTWVVETTIDHSNKDIHYIKAIVRTRAIARDLVKLLKKKYPYSKCQAGMWR